MTYEIYHLRLFTYKHIVAVIVDHIIIHLRPPVAQSPDKAIFSAIKESFNAMFGIHVFT